MQVELDMFIFLQKVFFKISLVLCTLEDSNRLLFDITGFKYSRIKNYLNKLNRFTISVILRCFFQVCCCQRTSLRLPIWQSNFFFLKGYWIWRLKGECSYSLHVWFTSSLSSVQYGIAQIKKTTVLLHLSCICLFWSHNNVNNDECRCNTVSITPFPYRKSVFPI